jgi:hypothetical protein
VVIASSDTGALERLTERERGGPLHLVGSRISCRRSRRRSGSEPCATGSLVWRSRSLKRPCRRSSSRPVVIPT